MPRIRSVHHGLFSDEAFVSCSSFARLLVIGLWTEADDKGTFEWKPLSLKMRLFPAESFNLDEMLALLDELSKGDIIKRYEVAGKVFGAIRNFRKYQRPQKPNDIHPMPNNLREYVGLNISITKPVQERSRTTTRISIQMEDGGGKREAGVHNIHSQKEVTSAGRHCPPDEAADEDGVLHAWDKKG